MRIGETRRIYLVEPLGAPARASQTVPTPVPDYIEPTIGWRSWFVVRVAGTPRLCSSCYSTVWEPGRAVVASCRAHAAPDEGCECGIYASKSPREAAPFLICPSRARVRAIGRVVGLAALWGKVVECEGGWRGARAYPLRIYVPAGPHSGSAPGQTVLRWWKPRYLPLPAEEMEAALGEYGVSVEFVPCESIAGLADALEARVVDLSLAAHPALPEPGQRAAPSPATSSSVPLGTATARNQAHFRRIE